MIFKQTITALIVLLLFNQSAFADSVERVQSVQEAQNYLSTKISDILKRKVIESGASIGIKGILYNGEHTELSEKIEKALDRRFVNDSNFTVYSRSKLMASAAKKELKQQRDFHYDSFDTIPLSQFKSIQILITGEISNHADGVTIDVTAFKIETLGKIAIAAVEIPVTVVNDFLIPSGTSGKSKEQYQQCQRGEAVQCTNLGLSYDKGTNGARQNDTKAVKYYQKGCDDGNANGCSNLGTMYKQGKGVKKDRREAAKYYRKGCDGGYAKACDYLGTVLTGYEKQEYQCQQGEAIQCTNLGFSYRKGKNGARQNDTQAVKYYQKGCNGGNAIGCSNLGFMYKHGKGVKKDRRKAAKYYRKGCDGGHAKACDYLGTVLTGYEKQEYQCQRGEANQCTILGFSYHKGKNGVRQNDTKAVKYYRKGCDGGSANGCSNLGIMYDRGEGVRKDHRKAVKYYRKGCDGGHANGCINLGTMYHHGEGVRKDHRKAVKYYRKGCDGGNAIGCSNLGTMYQYGTGVKKDHREAAKYYRKGCDGGYAKACGYAKTL